MNPNIASTKAGGGGDGDTVNDLACESVAGGSTKDAPRLKRAPPKNQGDGAVNGNDNDDDDMPNEPERRIKEGVNKRSRRHEKEEWLEEEDALLLLEASKFPREPEEESDYEEISRAFSQRFQRGRCALSCCSRYWILQQREAAFRTEELEAQINASRQETERIRQDIRKLEREKKNVSFESLLRVQEGQFKLVQQGTDGSVTIGTHMTSIAVETMIPITILDSTHPQWENIKRMNTISRLLQNFVDQTFVESEDLAFRRVGYCGKADIVSIVEGAVDDAIKLVETLHGSQHKSLAIRRERNLFSFRHDIMVVYCQNTPIFAVEVNEPVSRGSLSDAGKLFGRVYDYTELLQAYGLSKPYVVLTTFQESVLCWLEKSELGLAHSADKLEHIDDSNRIDIQHNSNAAERKLLRTKIYKSHNLVSLLYSGMSNAMDENSVSTGRLNKIYHLQLGKTYTFPRVLKTGPKIKYFWTGLQFKVGEKIESSQVRRSSRSKKNNKEEEVMEYYVIGTLGHGSTSNVYQAIDSNGRVVAIKVYVKADQYDQYGTLDKKAFKNAANAAMQREKYRLLNLYGALLGKEVRKVVLFGGLHCLVMPFFVPIVKMERESSLTKIRKVLQDHFVPNKIKYYDGDVRWRHVGIYVDASQEEHIILYDLADLEPLGDDNSMVQRHCQILEERCAEEDEATVRRFVGMEDGTQD